MSFLNLDSKFMVALSRTVDYIHVNLLCLLCCLPIVTAGASITAKYYVSMKMVRGEEPVITRSFFKAFRENFAQATIIWLMTGSLILVYIMDWWLMRQTQQSGISVLQIVFLVLCLLIVNLISCAFPMLARFKMTVPGLLKSAFIFSIIHLPRMLLALFLDIIPFMVGYLYLRWFLLVWLLVSAAVTYFNSQMYVEQFKKLERTEQEEDAVQVSQEG